MIDDAPIDAFLLLSFGGPEGRGDVIPFLENVTRGRNVPRDRLEKVAQHYYQFDGISPINNQCRALIKALEKNFDGRGIDLPIYWGNRNWHPMIEDTMAKMTADGVGHAVCFVTSAFSSYSGCRQYREDIQRAQDSVGENAPLVTKIGQFYDYEGFIGPIADSAQKSVDELGELVSIPKLRILFSAHSIPAEMGESSRYVEQLRIAARLVVDRLSVPVSWELVFQSRSGPPSQPWLEPDIAKRIAQLPDEDVEGVIVVPVGFVSDHLEVIYDLDCVIAERARALGLEFHRVPTVGTALPFVDLITDLVNEKLDESFVGPRHLSEPLDFEPCSTHCCGR